MSTGKLDVDKLTFTNGAVETLQELLFLSTVQSELLEKIVTIVPGAVHGKKVAGIGEMGLVGKIEPNCAPTWNKSRIATQEKEWDLGEFTIAEELCYKDFNATLVQHSLRKKTAVADMTGGDFLNIVVEPTLHAALDKMLWRLYWFGDKQAKNVEDGGIISDGIDPEFFHVADGFFKRLEAITSANSAQRVQIAANTEATYVDQREAIKADGVATKIFDELIYNADIKLRQASDRVVLCTQSYADALAIDVKRTTGSDLQWEAMLDGMAYATRFNGEQIIALPRWDEMILAFEDNGTILNKPHRVLYASRGTLWAGIASENTISEVDVFFDKKTRSNHILAVDEIGTLVWEDGLIQYAY